MVNFQLSGEELVHIGIHDTELGVSIPCFSAALGGQLSLFLKPSVSMNLQFSVGNDIVHVSDIAADEEVKLEIPLKVEGSTLELSFTLRTKDHGYFICNIPLSLLPVCVPLFFLFSRFFPLITFISAQST